MAFPCNMCQDKYEEVLATSALMTKYAGIVVTSLTEKDFYLSSAGPSIQYL